LNRAGLLEGSPIRIHGESNLIIGTSIGGVIERDLLSSTAHERLEG